MRFSPLNRFAVWDEEQSRHFHFNNFFVLMRALESKFFYESVQGKKIVCIARDMLRILWRDFCFSVFFFSVNGSRNSSRAEVGALESLKYFRLLWSFFTIQKFTSTWQRISIESFFERDSHSVFFNFNFVVRCTTLSVQWVLGMCEGCVMWDSLMTCQPREKVSLEHSQKFSDWVNIDESPHRSVCHSPTQQFNIPSPIHCESLNFISFLSPTHRLITCDVIVNPSPPSNITSKLFFLFHNSISSSEQFFLCSLRLFFLRANFQYIEKFLFACGASTHKKRKHRNVLSVSGKVEGVEERKNLI